MRDRLPLNALQAFEQAARAGSFAAVVSRSWWKFDGGVISG